MKDHLNVSWGRKCASSGLGEEKVMPVPDKPVVLSQLLARGCVLNVLPENTFSVSK